MMLLFFLDNRAGEGHNFSMFKRILCIGVLIWLMAWGVPLKAAELGNPFPAISLDPIDFNVGDLLSPEPVIRKITINNFGQSLLYLSKIKYT